MRPETPHRTAIPVITGHFVEGPGYAAYRSRGTRDWLIIYTAAGKGRFARASGELIATPGDLVLHMPESPQDYGVEASLKHWELLWAHFLPRPQWHDLLRWPAEGEMGKGLLHIRLPDEPARRQMRELFLELHQLANGGLRQRQMFAMNQLERILLTADLHNPRSEQSRIDPRIRLAVEHICGHLAQGLGVDALAALCHLSPSRFAHLFRQQVGQSPQQFVELQRLNRAKELLALTPRTIQTIAYDLGFENPFYFTLRFRKHTGMSPSEYRKYSAG